MSKHIYKLIVSIVFILGLCQTLNAQWTSPGNGTTYTLPDLVAVTDGVVTNNGTTFSIHADLTLSSNDVLKIDNQVTRIDAVGVLITIQGSVVCTNTTRVGIYGSMNPDQQFSMTFDNATDCELKTLYFSDGAGIKVMESDVSFIDCKFVYFTRDHCNAVINFMNCNPTIEDCYFLRNEGAAISSPINSHGSPKILNNQLEENVTSDLTSPQINLGPGAEDTIYIVGNSIDDDYASHRVGGIAIADMMGTNTTKVLLRSNYIANGSYGYDQEGLNISSVIEWNQIVNNSHTDNPMVNGSGINLYGMDENNKAVIRNNIISGNLWGITVFSAGNANLGTEDDWGRNQIHDNGNGGVVYDLYNKSPYDIMAVGNDWGTTNEQEVEDHIVHQNDDPEYGLVTFIPFVGYDAVDESKAVAFEVAPNPVSGSFILTLDEALPSEVAIYNANGQRVTTQYIDNQINTIKIESLATGVYFVAVKNAKGTSVEKLVVK